MTSLALALLPVVLAAVFVTAGVLKLRRPQTVVTALTNFGVPAVFRTRSTALALAVGEILLGVALVTTRGWVFFVAGLVTVAATAVFVAITARAVMRGENFDCGCFGATQSPLGPAVVWRNALLLSAALGTAFLGIGSFPGVAAAIGVLDQGDLAWLVVVLLLASLTATFTLSVRRPLTGGASPSQPGDLTGTTLPDLYFATSADEPVRLMDMLDRPKLITIVRPGCHSCSALLDSSDDVRKQLPSSTDMLLIVAGDKDSFVKEHPDLAPFSLFGGWTLAGYVRVSAYPAAVLVGAGGEILADPVAGTDAVQELVERSTLLLHPSV
ncbi:MauE/DoxX family redox-associated membrane protein [Microbacterium sp. AGC85]